MPTPIERPASASARAPRSPSARTSARVLGPLAAPAAGSPATARRLALAPRLALAVLLTAGVVWFARLAVGAGATALGFTPTRTVAQAIAAILVVPACVGLAAALTDGAQALVRGRRTPATWSRVMAEALAGLVLGAFVGVLQPAVWPGLAALAVAAVLGLNGFVRWRPQAGGAEERASVPLVLLLFDEPRRQAVRPVPARARERRAA
jgi:hypothetical protein